MYMYLRRCNSRVIFTVSINTAQRLVITRANLRMANNHAGEIWRKTSSFLKYS